jgi:hypothetical protein
MARSSAPSHASDLRRLTRGELAKLGKSRTSKRYVAKSAGRITKRTPTYSDRFHHQLALSERLGRKVSKEQFQRTVETKAAFYKDAATALRQKNARNARTVRYFVPDIAPKDMATALQWHNGGYTGLNSKQKEQFRAFFTRYNADAVRQAFGSAPRDTGAFPVAA